MLSRAHHRDNACAAPQALFTPSQSLPAYQTLNSAVSRPSLSHKKLDLLCSALPATDHKTRLYIQDNMLISAPQRDCACIDGKGTHPAADCQRGNISNRSIVWQGDIVALRSGCKLSQDNLTMADASPESAAVRADGRTDTQIRFGGVKQCCLLMPETTIAWT